VLGTTTALMIATATAAFAWPTVIHGITASRPTAVGLPCATGPAPATTTTFWVDRTPNDYPNASAIRRFASSLVR
jgi:hypothetical protein